MGRQLTSIRALRREKVERGAESTGLSAPVEQNERDRDAARLSPPSATWMSAALVEQTRRVWSKAYGRVVLVEEAVEILKNVKRLATALVKASGEDQTQ